MKFELKLLFVFTLIIQISSEIHGIESLLGNNGPFSLSDADRESEAMRLFKIRAQGILPQIYMKEIPKPIEEKKETELDKLVESTGMKKFQKRYQQFLNP